MTMAKLRQIAFSAVALSGLVALAACESANYSDSDMVYDGMVAGDEPQAVAIGSDILAKGGNAMDAAVGVYFGLAVTLPSRAGLGGGGTCVVYNPERGVDSINFLPVASSGGGVAPLGARAMAALHARYGSMQWNQVLAPAEQLARFGQPVSATLADDFRRATQLAGDEAFRRIFAPGGRWLAAGEVLTQVELGDLLGNLRAQPTFLHTQGFAERFASATAAAGLPVSAGDLINAVPAYTPPIAVDVGGPTAYFSAPPGAGGVLAAQLYVMLSEVEDLGGEEALPAQHLFAEASAEAYRLRATWLNQSFSLEQIASEDAVSSFDFNDAQHRPVGQLASLVEPAGGTGFVTADETGTVVACSVTMNELFGSGRMASGTGIVLASPPPSGISLSPVAMVLAAEGSARSYGAFAAGDGAAGVTALVRVAAEILLNERQASEAVAIARVHHNGAPDATYAESANGQAVLQGLAAMGHAVREIDRLGLVSAFYCLDGVAKGPVNCTVANDPRGTGAAAIVNSRQAPKVIN